MLTGCEWVSREDRFPEKDQRVLAFSPVYPEGHSMRYRLIEGQFIRISIEVTHWIDVEELAIAGGIVLEQEGEQKSWARN